MKDARIQTGWISHLKQEERDEFISNIMAASPVLERLQEIIEGLIDASETDMRKVDNYKLAAWPYLQADRIGEQRAYNKILTYLQNARPE